LGANTEFGGVADVLEGLGGKKVGGIRKMCRGTVVPGRLTGKVAGERPLSLKGIENNGQTVWSK